MSRLDDVAMLGIFQIEADPDADLEMGRFGPPPWPREVLRGFPPMKAGDRVRCRVCAQLHTVEDSPYRDPKGRALLLAVACGSRRIVVGGQGRSLVGRVEPPEEGGMGQAAASQFSEADQRLAVRRILLGRSTLDAEAKRRHTSVKTVEHWLRDPELRGDLKITQQSTWQPKARYTAVFKRGLAARVQAGESPATIAREFSDLLPGEIRHWSLGHDLEDDPKEFPPAPVPEAPKPPEPQLHWPQDPGELVEHLRKTRAVSVTLVHGELTVRPRGVLSRAEAERLYAVRAAVIAWLAAQEAPPAPPPRHPKRDEAVQALHGGMAPLEIIGALELAITVDALRDWLDEDRAAGVGVFYVPKPEPAREGVGSRSPFAASVREEAIGRIAAGEAPVQVASALGIRSETVRQWLREAGMPWKRTAVAVSAHTPEQRRAFAMRLLAGEDVSALAREAGVRPGSVEHWVREFGLRPPRYWHPKRNEAVRRVLAGESFVAVAAACEVSDVSVRTWVLAARAQQANGKAEPKPPVPAAKVVPAAARVMPKTPWTPPPPPPAPPVVAAAPEPPAAPVKYDGQPCGRCGLGESAHRNADHGYWTRDPSQWLPIPDSAAPAPAPAPAPRKLVAVVRYACPQCGGAIELPPVVPGQMRMRTGECPHCNAEIDL